MIVPRTRFVNDGVWFVDLRGRGSYDEGVVRTTGD